MAVFTVGASIDSMMHYLSPSTNFGDSEGINLGAKYANDKSALYRRIGNFNVSRLVGTTINSAKLVCYAYVEISGPFDAAVYRCTRPYTWTEMGVTWDKYDGVNDWTAGGGDYSGTPAAVGYAEPSGTGSYDITGLLAFVTDAIASRDNIVSLILMAVDEDPGSDKYVSISSRQEETDGQIPWYLEIDYTGTLVRPIERGFLRGVERGVERGGLGF